MDLLTADFCIYSIHTMQPGKEDLEMFLLFERTPDLVCVADKDGFFKKVNRAVIDTLEYTQEELFSRPISDFIHPEDKVVTREQRSQLLAGKALINFENRYVSRTGKIICLHWTSIYLPENNVVFAIAKNVTARKQVDKEIEEKFIRYRSIASHFKASIEKDRKYFALELHEELAQLAAAVKIDIDWLKDNIHSLAEPLKDRMNRASAISDLLIKTIQKISFSVSPNSLDDFGLNETLKWLCDEFKVTNGISCSFKTNLKEESLSPEVKLDFFRICQEALSNVLHHSQASKVNVCICEDNNKVSLCIADNGKGYKVEEKIIKHGLTSINERAASINAELFIESGIGEGTKINVSIAKATLV